MTEALMQSALRLHQAGRLAEAAQIYSQILRADPRNFQALYLFGFVKLQDGQYEEAQQLIGEAVKLNPRSPDGHYNRGWALQALGRLDDALACFDSAIALNPRYDEALTNRGAVLLALRRYGEALTSLDAALALRPDDVEALAARANALTSLGRHAEALTSLDKALARAPGNAELWNNRGALLLSAKRPSDAFTAFDRALALAPNHETAIVNRCYALLELKRPDDALASYGRAIAAKPQSLALRIARAEALVTQRRFHEAAEDYTAALAIDPSADFVQGNIAYCRLNGCDWRSLTETQSALASDLRAGKRVLNPFHALALIALPEDLQHAARLWAADKYPSQPQPLHTGGVYRHEKIRVAYLSADFNEHAVSTLMQGVFAAHDKTRFETHAISFTRDTNSARRPLLMRAFDSFTDVEGVSDADVAQMLRRKEVDIAVDLMGFTGNCRPGILAFRPVPLQVNYLGFPGTLGMRHIDYILADRTVIPEDERRYYDEAVVYLPDTYLPNDSNRPIAERTPTRAEAGLPGRGFVYCSFNNSYKFTPDIFDIWMRLLQQTPESVLWLPRFTDEAAKNLRREAHARSVAPERLVFAAFVGKAEDHLVRLKLADLFLDTLPYNAHSTACDALWAGLPVLTRMGTAFAGRVAASLLRAMGLPELIAHTAEDYEVRALKLAQDPAELAAIKAKLLRQRETSPVFDTARLTRNLEAAYLAMWERARRSEPPASIP